MTAQGREHEPLGEHGRAFVEDVAQNSSRPRVRQAAREVLAEDPATGGNGHQLQEEP